MLEFKSMLHVTAITVQCFLDKNNAEVLVTTIIGNTQ